MLSQVYAQLHGNQQVAAASKIWRGGGGVGVHPLTDGKIFLIIYTCKVKKRVMRRRLGAVTSYSRNGETAMLS